MIITVIIPVYNREDEIKVALDSLLDQDCEDWNCIVVDDGSEDGTIDVLEEYSNKHEKISFYKREINPKGECSSRNVGIMHCQTDYVQFLDSDDFLVKDCIRKRIEAIKADVEKDWWVFLAAEIKTETEFIEQFLEIRKIPWNVLNCVWRAEYLKKIDYFNTEYRVLVDLELHLRGLINTSLGTGFVKIAKEDTVYNMPTTNRSLTSRQRAKDHINSLIKYFTQFESLKEKGFEKSLRIGRVHALLSALEFNQYHKNQLLPELEDLKVKLCTSNLKQINPLISFYFRKLPPIKGVGTIINRIYA